MFGDVPRINCTETYWKIGFKVNSKDTRSAAIHGELQFFCKDAGYSRKSQSVVDGCHFSSFVCNLTCCRY